MALKTATWVHGNALTVVAPNSVDQIMHEGSGTIVDIRSGTQPWFHIPISTPVLINNVRSQLFRVFILFQTRPGDGIITDVWVYDGESLIHQFTNLSLEGAHASGLDSANMFVLPAPHSVSFGIGISFRFAASTPIDGPEQLFRIFIATAGADFNM